MELEALDRKPACFVVFGKPGAGKTTLAKQISSVWKCELVDGTTTIEEAIHQGTVLGIEAKKRLCLGEELDECFVAELLKEKLNSPRIKHYGYVLDCFPSACKEWKSYEDQLQFLQALELNPDFIINLKIPDQDLEERRVNQRVNPITNKVYTQDQYSPQAEVDSEENNEEDEAEDLEENEVDEEEAVKETDDLFADDMAGVDVLDKSVADQVDHLVQRPEDSQSLVQEQIQYFKDNILRIVEDFIICHNQQYILELDANLSPQLLLKGILSWLNGMGVSRTPVPKRLLDPQQEEEEPEGIDNEQFLSQLAGTGVLLPNFRWHRSRWGRYCPVELVNGNMVPGRMEFSVGFLDKMYSMSTAEALTQFMTNPRPYLKPPNPQIPCKVCVLGPPISGKSTLAKALASKYNAMVIDIGDLLVAVKESAQQAAIEEAKQEAKAATINTLTAQLMAQKANDQKDGEADTQITEEHPQVVEAVASAAEKARNSTIEITQEMYVEALKTGISTAEERRRESNPNGAKYGGWVIDGFPLTRENWAAMIENNLLPDFVLNLDDAHAQSDYLQTRIAGLSADSAGEGDAKKEGDQATPPEVGKLEQQREEYKKRWAQLSSSIKGSAIDPISIDCTLPVSDVLERAISRMEGVFAYRAQEYSALEDDADADDDPILDPATEEEGDNEELNLKRKPWGDTLHYCPVALNENAVLWPGSQETAVRYRDRLYYLSSEEAKEKFVADPLRYTAKDQKPIKPPPFRALLLGPNGSGKTTVGRELAQKMNIFHISFRSYLQEEILAKMKKPPLVDEDDWEGAEVNEDELLDETDDNVDDEELDADVKIALTESESEIRAYLLHNEPLAEETIEKFANIFWNNEPYKSTGFIMEGFPQSPDELRYLCSKGFYPDVAVVLQIDEGDVLKRLLPGKMEIWRRKRNLQIERKARSKAKRISEWEKDKEKRKAELTVEYEEKVAEKKVTKEEEEDEGEEEEEEEDEDLVEYKEQMAEIDQEEFVDEEEEEEEESETDATDRIKTSITEKFEELTEALTNIQDVLTELQIPHHVVNAKRQIPVVGYSLNKVLRPYTVDRSGLLAKTTTIDGEIAKKLLDHGYKQLSKFKTWCPVKLMEMPKAVLPEIQQSKSQLFPVIYHESIYFLSSSSTREQFMSNPEKYLSQTPPRPGVPVRLAIVGPPKSGKSDVARHFEKECGCLRLSVGEAIRRVIAQFPNSKLIQVIQSHLKAGQTIPDDLCVYALERALLDVQCQTRGYVLDGWPLTKSQVDLLTKFRLIPVCIVEVEVSNAEILRRAAIDRKSLDRIYPVHDSDSILLVRANHFQKHVEAVKTWYVSEYDNWHTVDGEASRWLVWDVSRNHALYTAQQIQQYLFQVSSDHAASLAGLCITPSEFQSRLGEFAGYCPVSLALKGELVDCRNTSLTFAAEYRGKYYKMASKTELDQFLASPDEFILPKAPRSLPPTDLLPRKRSYADVKALFPKQIELQCFCPVAYVEGKYRYETLIPGNPELVAEYKGKLFCFSSEINQEKFMRKPNQYEVKSLPNKLPPLKQPVPVTSLPMLGYLEQTVATAVINALSTVGSVKPKFPFLSSTSSALLFVAYHLKAFNPNSSEYVRQKYRKRVEQFKRQCKLIDYLSDVMRQGYQGPTERPIDFNHKMGSFLKLKDTCIS